MKPNWPKIYTKETISLRCDLKRNTVENKELKKPPNVKEYEFTAYVNHRGRYRCTDRDKTHLQSSTKWS